jgi:hypothetical protein
MRGYNVIHLDDKKIAMHVIKKKFIACFVFCMLVNCTAFAATANLPWSTSFENCSNTNYPDDGWASGSNDTVWNNVNVGSGGPVCVDNGFQQISTDANYPGGAGGCGWRRWVCGGPGGRVTPATGSIIVHVNKLSEFWLRFYMRWQAGFEWNSRDKLFFQKILFLRPLSSGGSVMDFQGPDHMTMTTQGGKAMGRRDNVVFANCPRCGWNTTNPNGEMQRNGIRLGDGSWHAIEIHVKDQSGAGTFDGEWDLWIDGVLKSHVTGINYNRGAASGVTSIQFMINQRSPSNAKPMYNDIDDIAISATGYIGTLAPYVERSSSDVVK